MEKTIFLSDDKAFHTIEGEGEHVGKPSVFMRLAMCNLTCKGFASKDSPHGCDSFVSWSVKNRFNFEQLFKFLEDNNFIALLRRGDIFKITGGEPLIQQKNLIEFIREFSVKYRFIPRIDFETNATILPDPSWQLDFYATFTTSPKLASNGDPENKRYIPDVLNWHSSNGSGFKFVIVKPQDLEEIQNKYIERFNIRKNKVWLMPCCGSRDEHVNMAPIVADLCKQEGYNFSPRLQLVIWDKALKV
ncbi:MAG: 7-carboxy-7-deazaguanine synthase QueE [Proteobacteria bacterium]|nr:7-carboxy-7-deazaguanine synthase QueE [Pseudomonadota bacterium]NBP14780.1 7-carboxy-7-deazaguanine synthase QueE [bacterium]